MAKYRVDIHPNAITYEVEADSEDEAYSIAEELTMNTNAGELLEGAIYEAEEI